MAIQPHGLDTFACGEVDLADRDRTVFYIIDWPDAWTRFYVGTGMIDRDPLVDALATRRDPFTWTDLRADRALARAGGAALDAAAAAGWVDGLVVPLPTVGTRAGLVSMVGHREIADPALRAYLCLIATCLQSYVRTLVAKHGFAMPPMGLTEREIASLRLVARGKSDAAIASELGVAVSTAHEFVEKAKRRLKARTRAEMVATAASFGIIDI
ncbi:helix-turn-helix transcriptional regulator [Glacieibacterium megasporae]|uniref:helix-turn-helix transcriptional regulator n=1 Tax=Glacieibacterium megasporae TaxID=2835787 RepID=UPI001C1DE1F0|nr:LuxR family transcriptional regulator [Polymorphobacter megasporae]UAJ09624.1 LuxR family transcriptional regulator [Polymorphobacter megasporae]